MELYKKKNSILWFANIAEVICGLFGLIILIISIIQVILRVGYSIALPWVFELTSLLVVYSVFFGASAIILKKRAARVTFFLDMMPNSINIFFNFIIGLAMLIMGFALIVGGWEYKGILSTYMMSNIPLSSELFAYPIIIFGLTLSFQGVISFNQALRKMYLDKK